MELDFLGLRPAATTADDHDHNRHGSTGSAASSSIRGPHPVLNFFFPRRNREQLAIIELAS